MNALIQILILAVAVIITFYLLKKGTNVGMVMLMDSVFVAVLFRVTFTDTLRFALNGLVSDKTLKLILALFLIMMLENIMRSTGAIKAMVESLKELVKSNRLAAAFLPAVLGLLPSPGGARFSCPMVEEITKESTDEDNKAFVNYWFRHIWMDGFILYPGIIVGAELLGISVISFFFHLIPFMVLNVLIGAFLGLRRIKKEAIPVTRPWKESLRIFTKALLPIILVILIYIALLNVTGYSLEIACILMVIALLIVNKYDAKRIVITAKEAFPVKLVIIIIGVMIFKEILLGSGAMDQLPELMERYHIPAAVLFMVLPFLGGFSSGITVSYISMTFPVLIPLGLGENIWYCALAFISGAAGTMLTPLHLCAVMTADFFKSSLGKLLQRVAVGQVVLVAAAAAIILFILT